MTPLSGESPAAAMPILTELSQPARRICPVSLLRLAAGSPETGCRCGETERDRYGVRRG